MRTLARIAELWKDILTKKRRPEWSTGNMDTAIRLSIAATNLATASPNDLMMSVGMVAEAALGFCVANEITIPYPVVRPSTTRPVREPVMEVLYFSGIIVNAVFQRGAGAATEQEDEYKAKQLQAVLWLLHYLDLSVTLKNPNASFLVLVNRWNPEW